MKRISIISALLLAVLIAGHTAATAPCETQTPELQHYPTVSEEPEEGIISEEIGEIQKRLMDWDK